MGTVESDVFDFLVRHLGVDRVRVSRDTRLLQDLGVEGDDAAELMDAFARQFSVDMAGFTFGDYFGAEPSLGDPLWFLPSRMKRRMEKKALSAAQLVASADRGKWTPDKSR